MTEFASNPATPWDGENSTNQPVEPAVLERLIAESSVSGPIVATRIQGAVRVQLPELPDDPDASSVVQLAIAAAVETFLDHDEAAAHGVVRGVHQARVGLRRFRSHLRTFRRIVDNEWAGALSAEAAWLADSLGAIRDLDVLKLRLIEGAMLQVPEHAPAIAGLVSVLEREREEALVALREVRNTARFDGLVGRLVEAARQLPSRGRGSELADYLIPRLLQRSWRELREATRTAHRDPTIENLHTVRIRAKRMRYACEAATPVLGSDAKRAAKAAESLQERLGEWHDASRAQEWLEVTGREHPNLAVVALRLSVLESAAAETALETWKTEFREIKRAWKVIDPSRGRNNR
jgi:CHAD domain-containing protein